MFENSLHGIATRLLGLKLVTLPVNALFRVTHVLLQLQDRSREHRLFLSRVRELLFSGRIMLLHGNRLCALCCQLLLQLVQLVLSLL